MGGAHQPFLYESDRGSARFPEKPFDPKSITRASWEPKPAKPKPEGPLLGYNRHPDAHEVLTPRQPFQTMSSFTKAWIKAMRVVQLLMRLVQCAGAAALLVLAILLTHVSDVTAWVIRITAGIVIIHTAYGVYHLARPAGYRTPASSAAYQMFAAFVDCVILAIYVYGFLAVRQHGAEWQTRLSNTAVLPYLTSTFRYVLLGAGGLHIATLLVGVWLGAKFRQITLMPPDMNPLEQRFTSRTHARRQTKQHQHNKSSLASTSTLASLASDDSGKTLVGRPQSMPFMHTRAKSSTTSLSSPRDSRLDLPSRQSQMSQMGYNASQNNSVANLKRSSVVTTPPGSAHGRGAYTEIALSDGYANVPSPQRHAQGRAAGNKTPVGGRRGAGTPTSSTDAATRTGSPAHAGNYAGSRFTENWYASDAPRNQTQQAVNNLVLNATGKRRNYAPVRQAYDFPESDGEASDTETVRRHRSVMGGHLDDNDYSAENDDEPNYRQHHPDPLRSHPPPPAGPPPPRTKTPLRRPASTAPTVSSVSSMSSSVHTSTTHEGGSVLGELNLNDRRVSGGGGSSSTYSTHDIADAQGFDKPVGRGLTAATLSPPQAARAQKPGVVRQATKRWTWAPRGRDSSIQPDEQFFSKPYGELPSAAPPIVVGRDLSAAAAAAGGKAPRQVSSGNDYDLGNDRYLYYGENSQANSTFGRRNVSGKVAEEGRAYTRYSTPNE